MEKKKDDQELESLFESFDKEIVGIEQKIMDLEKDIKELKKEENAEQEEVPET